MRIDYCNSLFFNMPKENIYKLQKVQNSAARLVTRKLKRDSISENPSSKTRDIKMKGNDVNGTQDLPNPVKLQ
jgi:hypothetical protein